MSWNQPANNRNYPAARFATGRTPRNHVDSTGYQYYTGFQHEELPDMHPSPPQEFLTVETPKRMSDAYPGCNYAAFDPDEKPLKVRNPDYIPPCELPVAKKPRRHRHKTAAEKDEIYGKMMDNFLEFPAEDQQTAQPSTSDEDRPICALCGSFSSAHGSWCNRCERGYWPASMAAPERMPERY